MAIHYRTRGFILKKTDWGEADQIISVFTKDFGRVEILGKAIRKITSKLGPAAGLFYLSEIEFIQGKARKTLTDADPIQKFENIKKDLGKVEIAHQFADVLHQLIRGEEKDEEVLDLLNESFGRLNDCRLSIADCQLLYYYFFWNLVSLLGYEVDFYNCVICRKKLLPSNLYFNAEEGGIVCSECLNKAAKCGTISTDVIKILRLFLKNNWKTLSKIKMKEKYLEPLKLVSENYLACYKKER